jgi:periplasmic protein TonB
MRSILYASCLLIAIAPGPAQQTKPEEPIYKLGKDIKPPQAISSPQPDFSADTRRGRFNGVVVVTGYVGTDGKFHDAKVLRSIGDSVLDAKVLGAVKKWRFHPCTRDDKPVSCTINIDTAIRLD